MKGLNKFISNNKKALGALVVVIGTAFTPVPSAIWNIAAPLIVNGVEQATEGE
ncbi:hypothetical protein ACFQ45_13175 [Rhodanobacter aciditrophus]|uniref:Uncharacterized protein n=1 Tax=Rhodanobacter aciditrophus TaxID=1623218 RepID=A0ABW4B276_9GAMM